MFCRPKKRPEQPTGWGKMRQMLKLSGPPAEDRVQLSKKQSKEEEQAEKQQREEREKEREQELKRMKEEVESLQKQVAEMDSLRYEIRRLQSQSATWTSVLHSMLFTLVLHPDLADTFKGLVNRQLREVIADMDIISSAECLSLTLPSSAERTPDIELCESYCASGTTGTSLWRVRVNPGAIVAELHVTGKKMVKFKADLTVSFTFEGLVLFALYPRDTNPELMPTNLPIPSTAGLITRVSKVPLDIRRARYIGRVPSQPHCWLQFALIEQPKFDVPIQSKVTAAKLALPVQDRIKSAIQKAVGKVMQQKFLAPVNFMFPITLNFLDSPAAHQLVEEPVNASQTDQTLQTISQLIGKEQKWELAKDICAGLDATKSKMQPLIQATGMPSAKAPKVATAAMLAAYVQVTGAEQNQDWTDLLEQATQYVQMQIGAERAGALMHCAKLLCLGQDPPAPPPPPPPSTPAPAPAPQSMSSPNPPTSTHPQATSNVKSPTSQATSSVKSPPPSSASGAASSAPSHPAVPSSPPTIPPPLPTTNSVPKPAPPAPAPAASSSPLPSVSHSSATSTSPAAKSEAASASEKGTGHAQNGTTELSTLPEHRRQPSQNPKEVAQHNRQPSQPSHHQREPSQNSTLTAEGRSTSFTHDHDPAEMPDTDNLLAAEAQPASVVDTFADDIRAMNAKVLKRLDDFKWSDITGSSDKPAKSPQDEVLTQVQRTVKGTFGRWDQVSKVSRGTLSTKFCDAIGVSQSSTSAIVSATGLSDPHKAAAVATAALVVGYIQLTNPMLQRDWEELRQQAMNIMAQYLGGHDVDVASEVHSSAKIALLESGVVTL